MWGSENNACESFLRLYTPNKWTHGTEKATGGKPNKFPETASNRTEHEELTAFLQAVDGTGDSAASLFTATMIQLLVFVNQRS